MQSASGLEEIKTFSLLGGPLHRLGRRVGLVRGAANTAALGLAFGVFLWLVLMVLALTEGVAPRVFSLGAIGGHVRLLVAIPLFFLCESWLDPRVTEFVAMIVRSGIVPKEELPGLQAEIVRTARRRDSWALEALFLAGAALLSLFAQRLNLGGTTSAYDPSHAVAGGSLAGLWYWSVCLTLFRFLILRWIWRLGLWSHFLWRVAKLKLHLVPTHPDGAAGLAYLETVHAHCTPLVLAISAIQAASLAEELIAGTIAFESIYPALAIVLLVDAILFLGPLFIFTPKLWACRDKGLSDYMSFAESYVSDFDAKWLRAGPPPGEPLLGTADLQSLADLSNSVKIVRDMRRVPMSRHLPAELALAALAPMLPLLLFKYPLGELTQRFFTRLTGW